MVANKVWQGLACGRVVVTQRSSALDDVAEAVGDQLVQVEPGRAGALADALVAVDPTRALAGSPGVHDRLEALVARSFRLLSRFVLASGGRA